MLDTFPLVIAQAVEAAPPAAPAPAAPAATAWWQILLENSLGLTITFIFLAAIVSVVLTQRRRDKCLKLLHDFHVAYLTVTGSPVWGDLVVYSSGIELRFDAPATTRRGLVKSSAMIYQKDLPATLALLRVDHGLTDDERPRRLAQVRRTFRPNIFRRTRRWLQNLLATLKDAFSQALTALIGAVLKSRAPALASQEARVQQIGQTILGATANAYEPILEAHIGKPVILRLVAAPPAAPPGTPPPEPAGKLNELPGYLVDYNDTYIAVFNTDHTPEETLELTLSESAERPNVKVDLLESDVSILNTGPDVIVVKSMTLGDGVPGGGDDRFVSIAVPLLVGCRLTLRRTPGVPVRLVLERTRKVDIIAPRAHAVVNFAAESELRQDRRWLGLAPEHEAEESAGIAERVRKLPASLFQR